MSKCKHLIGEVNSVGDFSEVITVDELTQYFTSAEIKQGISLIGGWGLYKFGTYIADYTKQ